MTRWSRLFATAVALLHLTVAGLGPIADATLEAREQSFVSHFESERSEPCTAGHDHLFCQICRALGVNAGPTRGPVTFQLAEVRQRVRREVRSQVVFRFTLASHGPRAPPAVA